MTRNSRVAIDKRMFIGQAKQRGFYVFYGEVALLKKKSHRKFKSKKSVLPAHAGPSNFPHAPNHTQAQPQGLKDVPTALLSEEEILAECARVSAESLSGKKQRNVNIVRPPFHPDGPDHEAYGRPQSGYSESCVLTWYSDTRYTT